MYKRKTFFIGCGDGRELLPLANDRKHLLIGLEPIDQLFVRACHTLAGFPNVQILHCRVQDLKNQYAGAVDQIYFIFPTPGVLRREAGVIVDRVGTLLAEGGVFRLYTEITLSHWPDPEDRARLEIFLQVLKAKKFSIDIKEIGYEVLPIVASQSHCGLKFKAHCITRYTAVTAWKTAVLM